MKVLILLILVVFHLICGVLCSSLGKKKNYNSMFWIGLVLGIIGLIYVITRPINSKEEAQTVYPLEEEPEDLETFTYNEAVSVFSGFANGTPTYSDSDLEGVNFEPEEEVYDYSEDETEEQ